MTTLATHGTTAHTRADGFGQLLRAEWTKLRSVPRWVLTLLCAIVLTVLMSLVAASSSGSDANNFDVVVGPDGTPVADDFYFVHQPLSGDGTVTARVLSQQGQGLDGSTDSQEWARAGLMIKESTQAGSPYAAIMVTPGHGVRMQSNFTTDLAGTGDTAPHWLRLSRSGSSITGYQSADGTSWDELGTVGLDGLPETIEVGLFVASPDAVQIERQFGSTSMGLTSTFDIATFDNLSVEPHRPQRPAPLTGTEMGARGTGEFTESDRTFTVSGSGDIAPNPPDDDVVQVSLIGFLVGLMVVATVAVLFVTSEYKRGMIHTSFMVSPRRGRVLAAKALVIGAATFVVGLIASLTAFLLVQPVLRSNGFAPPAYPHPSLSDPSVLRALVGSAALLGVGAVFSLGLGAILRRSAGAITLAIGLLILPLIVAIALPPTPAEWLMRLTPAGGFAIQRAKEPTDALFEPWSMIEPWAGFGALCVYAAAALALAHWLLRRRDT